VSHKRLLLSKYIGNSTIRQGKGLDFMGHTPKGPNLESEEAIFFIIVEFK
jgi:hypothetical protein